MSPFFILSESGFGAVLWYCFHLTLKRSEVPLNGDVDGTCKWGLKVGPYLSSAAAPRRYSAARRSTWVAVVVAVVVVVASWWAPSARARCSSVWCGRTRVVAGGRGTRPSSARTRSTRAGGCPRSPVTALPLASLNSAVLYSATTNRFVFGGVDWQLVVVVVVAAAVAVVELVVAVLCLLHPAARRVNLVTTSRNTKENFYN